MPHYSEMDFLFESQTNRDSITRQLKTNSDNNTRNIFKDKTADNGYVVFKRKKSYSFSDTNTIKNYYKEQIYDKVKSKNPYTAILEYFNTEQGKPGAGFRIKAADLAYLRDLGVYPINRMAILRRFPEGMFVNEDLNEMYINPISTVIGWIKPDQNFGTIGFNEVWTKIDERFDVALKKILSEITGGRTDKIAVPIPDFAQGILFEFYRRAGLTRGTIEDDSDDESYELYNQDQILNETTQKDEWVNDYINAGGDPEKLKDSSWGLLNIPVGDPNVLKEGPFRDPTVQNIQSSFQFDLETTYEQKLLGDVDPGSAMLDIIDNLLKMGTSNMAFYWGSDSPTVKDAKNAITNKANNVNSWWVFVVNIMITFWDTIVGLFNDLAATVSQSLGEVSNLAKGYFSTGINIGGTKGEYEELTVDEYNEKLANNEIKAEDYQFFGSLNPDNTEWWKGTYRKISQSQTNSGAESEKEAMYNEKLKTLTTFINTGLQTILTSTIAIHRYRLRGSLELMVGGKDSSAPWHLSIGNPFTPWLQTSHIIVRGANFETSTEMGFNDQPQWIKAKFSIEFSRSLGKQEIMRMLNNSNRRTYSTPLLNRVPNFNNKMEIIGINDIGQTFTNINMNRFNSSLPAAGTNYSVGASPQEYSNRPPDYPNVKSYIDENGRKATGFWIDLGVGNYRYEEPNKSKNLTVQWMIVQR